MATHQRSPTVSPCCNLEFAVLRWNHAGRATTLTMASVYFNAPVDRLSGASAHALAIQGPYALIDS